MNTQVLYDLIQFHTNRASGTWSFPDSRTKKAGRAIFFQDGKIAHAMSAYEGETLADVLVAQGQISPERLKLVIEGERRLSEEVPAEGLGRAVEGVAEKIVQGVLTDEMEPGSEPNFVAGGSPTPGAGSIHTRNAILRGLLAVSVGNYGLSLLGSPNQAGVLHPGKYEDTEIPSDLTWVLDHLGREWDSDPTKRTPVGSIVRRSGHERGRVCGLLFFLREIGAVTFEPLPTRKLAGDGRTTTGPVPIIQEAQAEVAAAPPPAPQVAIPEPIQAGGPMPPVMAVPPVPLPEGDEVEDALGGLFARGGAMPQVPPPPAPVPPPPPPLPPSVASTPRPVEGDLVVEAEIVDDVRPLAATGSGMGLVTRERTAAELAAEWGVAEDSTSTMAFKRSMPLMDRRVMDQRFFLEQYDPNLKAFAVPLVVEHKLHGKSLAVIMGGIGAAVALGLGAMGLVWVRTDRPKLLKPGTIKVDPKKGPVGFDRVSRVQALRDQELSTALSQGDAYVAKLQSDGKNPYVIRLGLAFHGQDVLKTLNAALGPGWQKEDVFILPIRLEGDKEAYQVFIGTYDEAEVEPAVAKLSKMAESNGGSSVTAYKLREIPRGA